MNELNTTKEIRLEKLTLLRKLGFDPYLTEKFDLTHTPTELFRDYTSLEGQTVATAGRVVSIRTMGKAMFMHLSDGDSRFQLYLKKTDLGETFWEIATLLDIGDHLGTSGELFKTKTGEPSIHVRSLKPLSKSFQILPLGKEKNGEQWYGLTNIDSRYRHRHLDLICNHESRKRLIDRMKIIAAVRNYLNSLHYLEVETPFLQLEAGGAAARPFKTHYNAYNLDVKLRISLELYLKRLICGDLPRVYEIGRVFRNEGVSNRHNPEFTMLEYYQAYANMEDMMETVEGLFKYVTQTVFGSNIIDFGNTQLDFSKPWKRVNLLTEIEIETGINPSEFEHLGSALNAMKRLGLSTEGETHIGGIIEKLLEKFVEPKLIEPTFVVGYPIETSPLAKKDPQNPKFTRRFEGYIKGREICNSFSEINDPVDQRERFEQQMQEKLSGNEEAHPMDEDYLFAMEGGMPPCGGVGIGLDRMAMILTGAESLREVLLFPMMKPEH